MNALHSRQSRLTEFFPSLFPFAVEEFSWPLESIAGTCDIDCRFTVIVPQTLHRKSPFQTNERYTQMTT